MTGEKSERSHQRIIDEHDAIGARRTTGATLKTGARWMGISQVLMQIVRIGSVFVLARLLTESEFGLVSLVTIVTTFYDRVLGDTGTSAALVRQPKITQSLASSVLWTNLMIGSAGTLLIVALAEPLAALLGESSAVDLLRFVALMAIIGSASYVPRALLRRRGMFRKLATANMLNAGTTAVVSIALAAADFREWSLAIGNMAGSAIFAIAVWAQVGWKPSRVFRRDELKSISKFSANLTGANFFGFLSFAGDRFIVGRFLGVADLGFYGLANRLMRYPVQTTSQTYRDVVFPSLAKLQDDPREVERVFGRSINGIAFALFPLCGMVAALSTPLVDVALTERWAPVADIVAIIAVTSALQALSNTTGSLYNSRGRSDLALRWQIGSSIVLLVSYSIGANWGLAGVAWGYLVGTALLTPIAFAIGLRLIGGRTWTTLGPTVVTGLAAAAASGTAYGVALAIERSDGGSMLRVISGAACGSVVYLAWAVLHRPPAALDLFRLIRRRVR